MPGEPRWTDEQVAELYLLAWDSGRLYERERIAAGQAELDACWRPAGRRSYEQQVAARRAELDAHARRMYSNTGRLEWPGTEAGGAS